MKQSNLSLTEWLKKLENAHAVEIQLGLDRVKQVAIKLNVLSPSAEVITVAGTNGKGSTVKLLETIYSDAGYRVGSYTSPHLINFNERIKINGKPIVDSSVITYFEQIEEARGTTHLTYFEVTTLAALLHFASLPLDIIILEVGLGGRLDATNIVNCDLAIITTIALDHQYYLGDTVEKIGAEKAGILREAKPLIYADDNLPESIKNKAQHLSVPIIKKNKDYSCVEKMGELQFTYRNTAVTVKNTSIHPNSIAAALMAVTLLQHRLKVDNDRLKQAVEKIRVEGRFQRLTQPHLTLLDVAHNPQAAENLARYVNQFYCNYTIHAVFAGLKDKDCEGIVLPFKKLVDYWYPAILDSDRALTPIEILQLFERCKITYKLCYNKPVLAYEAACKAVQPNSLILVFGSFLTVGPILAAYDTPSKSV